MLSVFISPLSWIAGLVSLALAYATFRSANPILGSFALFLFVIFAVSVSIAITHLLSHRGVRRFLFVAMVGLCAAIGVDWLFKQSLSVRWPVLLSQWLPNKLAASVAVSSQASVSLAVLTVLTVIFAVLSFLAFRVGIETEQHHRSNRFNIFGLINVPGRFGGLIRKDLRYASRLLDLYLAVPVIIICNIYLISNDAPSPGVFWPIVNLLLFPCMSLAFNGFGLDSPRGFDRYSLLPLSGRELILSKNLSFAVVALFLFSPIVPMAVWRMGAAVVGWGLVILVLVTLAYLTWGNWMSVNDPFRVQFYRFSSGGSPVDALGGLVFGGLPGIVAVYLLNSESFGGLWKLAALLVVYGVLCLLSLRWSASILESRRETVRLRLS